MESGDWICRRSLAELKLRDEGIIALGISRGRYLIYLRGFQDENVIATRDMLSAYSDADRREALDQRRCGEKGEGPRATPRSLEIIGACALTVYPSG